MTKFNEFDEDDCEGGYCPYCLDVCMTPDGEVSSGEDTACFSKCPACGYISVWIDSSPVIPVNIPRYDEKDGA